MAKPSFKELCLDTTSTSGEAGRFWADLTGCDYVRTDDPADPGDVDGVEEGMGIALCPVPEAKTVKNRVHLDVSVATLADVTERGGRILDKHEHWTVCQDPEGNEFCAFVREGELPAYRTFEIAVDSADAEAAARWWGEVFGVEAENDGKPWWWLQDVAGFPRSGPFFAMVFGPVPEPKTVKNRMHWDLYGDVADFETRGATKLWEMPRWTVLADPEGNEFCAFPDANR